MTNIQENWIETVTSNDKEYPQQKVQTCFYYVVNYYYCTIIIVIY